MLVLSTTSAAPRLPWKEQLNSSVCAIESSSSAYLLTGETTESLPQKLNSKECTLNSTIFLKLRPTDPLQATVAPLPEEDSPCMVSLAMFETVIFVSRTWSPGKNTIVVLEVKYSSASFAYSESVAQWVL